MRKKNGVLCGNIKLMEKSEAERILRELKNEAEKKSKIQKSVGISTCS